jgi:crotonobetaine/carnitine-CoA ligase
MSSIYDRFRDAARRCPDLPFLCIPKGPARDYLAAGAEFRYGQALSIVEELATEYADAGYGVGHRVAIVLENRPEHFWHLLALNAVGACAVPLNPDYLDHEFAYAIEFADSALVVGIGKRLEALRRVMSTLKSSVSLVDAEDLPARLPNPARSVSAPAVKDQREALIIYTSGTTGRPKGCIISNHSCFASGQDYASVGGRLSLVEERERLYVPLPTFHMNATILALNAVIETRGCLVMPDRFHPSDWWSELCETRATAIHYLGIIPPILLKAPRHPDETRHHVKFGLGAGVDPVLHKAFEERFGFPLVEVWGMTETSRFIADNFEPRRIDTRAFGKPHPPLEVRVVDEQDRPVPTGESGELLVRCAGPDPRSGFFSGYLKDEVATEAAWRGGWFHTGDMVSQGGDGVLYFVDRRKNIIRRSGENISAAEVEEALIASPEAQGVAVMAVADELRDEEVLACVKARPDVEPGPELAMTLFERARRRISYHKLPGWIVFVDEIPVTGTQKMRKGLIFPEDMDPRTHPQATDLRHLKKRTVAASQPAG